MAHRTACIPPDRPCRGKPCTSLPFKIGLGDQAGCAVSVAYLRNEETVTQKLPADRCSFDCATGVLAPCARAVWNFDDDRAAVYMTLHATWSASAPQPENPAPVFTSDSGRGLQRTAAMLQNPSPWSRSGSSGTPNAAGIFREPQVFDQVFLARWRCEALMQVLGPCSGGFALAPPMSSRFWFDGGRSRRRLPGIEMRAGR